MEQDEIPVYDVPFLDEHGDFVVDFVDGGDIMTWVTQGEIADRTRELLVDTDRGIALYRRMLLEQVDVVARRRSARRAQARCSRRRGGERVPDDVIELPQERDKYGDGAAFLADTIRASHVRHSPLRDEIAALLESPAESFAVRVVCHSQHLTGVGHHVRMHCLAVGLATAGHEVHLVDGGRPVPRPRFSAEPARIELPTLVRSDGGCTRRCGRGGRGTGPRTTC